MVKGKIAIVLSLVWLLMGAAAWANDDGESRQAGVVLETSEINSSMVEVGALALVVYGQGERHPTSGAWAKLDTARGHIKTIDRRRLILGLEPDGWSKWIALERVQALILVGSPSLGAANRDSTQAAGEIETAADRMDNDRVIEISRKELVQALADSGHAESGFQAMPDTISVKKDDRGGTTRRIKNKFLLGIIGGHVFLVMGALIGSGIDDYYGECRGWFPSNEQHDSEDGLCIDVGAFIGASTGWVLGAPIGVSMLEPNDRFIHTLGGSIGGFVTCGLFTMVSGGALWPSMIVAPVIFATLASEWSRHAELSRKPPEPRRFSLGLAPDRRGGLSAVATLRF